MKILIDKTTMRFKDVILRDDYEVAENEELLEVSIPNFQIDGEEGFISPMWNGEAWEESATEEEKEAWYEKYPAPEVKEPEPTDIDIIYDLISELYLEKDMADMGLTEEDLV